MKKFMKKAFTLVELLVVIAIVAILAVAGVVGYMAFTAKAQQSNDTMLVAQLNTYVDAAGVLTTINTPTDIREILLDDGYDLAALKLEAKDYKLAFDISAKKFIKMKGTTAEDEITSASDVFVFVTSEEEMTEYTNAGYSVYLQRGYDSQTISLTRSVGVDVGENPGITSVSYAVTGDASDIVVRTNSYTTDVTINTPGNAKHYGNVGKLVIEKVAMSSFHEFGKVRTVEIIEGNFVIEPKAVVTIVSVKAETTGKVKLDIKGTLDVVAGSTENYVVTAGAASETIDAPIEDNTLAIVDGVAKTSLDATADFADGKKVILLKDYTTVATLGSCEVVGNLTKFRANITGNKTISLKNIHSTGLNVQNFTGSLTLDGGLLEYDSSLVPNGENAAIYINTGAGTYVFKNMTIAANTNKGIKISKAASVTVDNCVFDAANLVGAASNDQSGSHARSLSAIDIQEQNTSATMAVTITGCTFKDIPQGTEFAGVKDSDTAAAIKLKAEVQGFSSVTITNNTFKNCYRDVGVGVCLRKIDGNFLNKKTPADMRANAIDSKFTISNNKTTLTEAVVSNRGYQTYEEYTGSTKTLAVAEKVGRLLGGCAVFETANSTHANDA